MLQRTESSPPSQPCHSQPAGDWCSKTWRPTQQTDTAGRGPLVTHHPPPQFYLGHFANLGSVEKFIRGLPVGVWCHLWQAEMGLLEGLLGQDGTLWSFPWKNLSWGAALPFLNLIVMFYNLWANFWNFTGKFPGAWKPSSLCVEGLRSGQAYS